MGKKHFASPPRKPQTMNGDNEAIWGFLLHLNSRIDGLVWVIAGGTVTLLAAVIGVLVAVLLK